jgi:hypothetical protein
MNRNRAAQRKRRVCVMSVMNSILHQILFCVFGLAGVIGLLFQA